MYSTSFSDKTFSQKKKKKKFCFNFDPQSVKNPPLKDIYTASLQFNPILFNHSEERSTKKEKIGKKEIFIKLFYIFNLFPIDK
jgi:hypothetical protein